MELYNNRMSIAHPDVSRGPVQEDSLDDFFLESMIAASEQHRREIYDIYFGGMFYHRDFSYGDVMGVSPTPGQYKNLLNVQEKFGIPISVTFNEMRRPMAIMQLENMHAFANRVQEYYDDGVRSCTISHTHLMRAGILQERFPEMTWKNTVNHRIRSTQEMVDYVKLGYDIIQLDRDFNRNLAELKKSKAEAIRLGVKTCLLVTEQCMPECPFKVEHDMWQSGAEMRTLGQSYWQIFDDTCMHWRNASNNRNNPNSGVQNPRFGTDIAMNSKEVFTQYAENTNVFKTSGRLLDVNKSVPKRQYHQEIRPAEAATFPGSVQTDYIKNKGATFLRIPDIKTAWDNDLAPIGDWLSQPFSVDSYGVKHIEDIGEIKEHLKDNFWNSEDGKDLEKTLRTCRNQCYQCHKCDRAFGMGDIDSILEV